MKKYRVHGVVEIEVTKEVWANNEDEAYEKAHDQLTYLMEYAGNGGWDKLVGVDGHDESVDTCGNEIEYNDIEELEDDPDYFECHKCGEECEVRENSNGEKYWRCEYCEQAYDEDGDETWIDEDEDDE